MSFLLDVRSKSRFAALDETAVFRSICRHEFPQHFLNMKHGERLANNHRNDVSTIIKVTLSRLAYPVYMLERLQEKRGERGYLILYDIACVLERHLRVYIATASSVLSMIACICAHIHTAYRKAHAAELLTLVFYV